MTWPARRVSPVVAFAVLAVLLPGCATSPPALTGSAGATSPAIAGSAGATSPAIAGSPGATAAAGYDQPIIAGPDWSKAGIVERGGGDPTRTTPPYVNPGSLGHPQAYQGGQADLLAVAKGGPGLVAVGYLARDFRAEAWSSQSGLTWTRAASFDADDSSTANAVAAAPGRIVAVGGSEADAAAWASTDGLAWERLKGPAFHDPIQVRMTALAAWSDGFVAAGYVGSLVGPIRAAFWQSPDGRAWRRIPDGPAFEDARVTGLAITADGSTLVAVGAAGDAQAAKGAAAWRSTDGERWQRAPAGPGLVGGLMQAVAAGASGFVAVGSDLASDRAMAWRSTDGLDWTQAPDAAALDDFGLKIEMRAVAWTGTRYLAGGHLLFGTQYPSAVVWTSDLGDVWEREPDVPAFSQGRIQGVAAGGPGLVAVGSFGSPDFSIPTVWVRTGD